MFWCVYVGGSVHGCVGVYVLVCVHGVAHVCLWKQGAFFLLASPWISINGYTVGLQVGRLYGSMATPS